MNRCCNRRSFLKWSFIALTGLRMPPKALASVSSSFIRERSLSLYNLHTGEIFRDTYWADGSYLPGALEDVNFLLRDYRTEEVKPIDKRLLDLLSSIQKNLKIDNPFQVVSGYRSLETNEMLRKKGCHVAKNSLHVEGRAIDLNLPGVQLSALRKMAVKLRSGGVGYYPKAHFVHIDTGRIRYW